MLIYEKEQETTEIELPMDDMLEDKTEGELLMTGLKIRELIDSKFMIYDKKVKKSARLNTKISCYYTHEEKNNLTILEVFKTFDIPFGTQ